MLAQVVSVERHSESILVKEPVGINDFNNKVQVEAFPAVQCLDSSYLFPYRVGAPKRNL